MAEASEGHAAFRESIVLNQEKSTVYNLRAQGRSVGDNKQTISEPDLKIKVYTGLESKRKPNIQNQSRL